MTQVVRFDGAPGAGKTHNLRHALSRERDKGLSPDSFYWLTFSRTGARDITDDIRDVFPDAESVGDQASTLHGLALSLCYRNSVIDAPRGADPIISQRTDSDVYAAYCDKQAMSYDPEYNDPTKILRGDTDVAANGNLFFALNDYLRQTCKPPEKYRHAPVDVPLTRDRVRTLLNAWDRFKHNHREYRLFEHGDYVEAAFRYQCVPDIDALLIDEFQDLAPLEYRLYKLWRDAGDIDTIYIAGDAGQSIYSFRGGTPYYFDHTDVDRSETLKASFRCKSEIADRANRLLATHPETNPRGFEGRETGGTVAWPSVPDEYGLRDAIINAAERHIQTSPSVFLLTRTRRQLWRLMGDLKAVGIPFEVLGRSGSVYTQDMKQWLTFLTNYQHASNTYAAANLRKVLATYPDADERRLELETGGIGFYNRADIEAVFPEYDTAKDILEGMDIDTWKADIIRAALDAPAALSPQDVHVGTIHRAKGLEAAAVFLFVETTSTQVKRYHKYPDIAAEEHRIYYVGTTRASDEIHYVRGYFSGPEAPPLKQLKTTRKTAVVA